MLAHMTVVAGDDVDARKLHKVVLRQQKGARRLKVKELLQDRSVRLNYIRGPENVFEDRDGTTRYGRGEQYGVVISKLVNGELYVGWSKLHEKDGGLYDRDYGILVAANRFQPLSVYMNNKNVPHDVRRTMAHLLARNVLYFRGK